MTEGMQIPGLGSNTFQMLRNLAPPPRSKSIKSQLSLCKRTRGHHMMLESGQSLKEKKFLFQNLGRTEEMMHEVPRISTISCSGKPGSSGRAFAWDPGVQNMNNVKIESSEPGDHEYGRNNQISIDMIFWDWFFKKGRPAREARKSEALSWGPRKPFSSSKNGLFNLKKNKQFRKGHRRDNVGSFWEVNFIDHLTPTEISPLSLLWPSKKLNRHLLFLIILQISIH